MNKVLFRIKGKEIRVAHVLAILIILILLFFVLKSCSKKNEDEQLKEDKLNQVCTLEKDNLGKLRELLERADLCSEQWFKDYRALISGLEEQSTLQDKGANKDASVKLGETHKQLIESLKDFDEEQSVDNLDKIDVAIKEYLSENNSKCLGEDK